nr:pollen-specific leucine-rich repeat extensin-like protein 2 [Penaeus vannamei]
MLDQDFSRSLSPAFANERNWYSWLFSKEIANYIHPSHLRKDDMKLVEGGYGAMGTSSQYCLRWNNHRNNLLAAFDQLLHVEAFTDVTLACEDGATLHAHRLVLAACSSYFQALFVNAHTANHPIVVLKDVRACDMRALLEYMYRGEVNIEHDALQGLLRVAESLKVKGLVEELGNETNAALRPPSPPHEASHPPSTPVDARALQDLPPRSRVEPPTSASGPAPLSVSSHEQVRASSPTPPLYPLPPPGHPLHRPSPAPRARPPDARELDLRGDARDLRDHLREHLREPLRDAHRESLRDAHRDALRDPRDAHEPRDVHTPGSLDSDPPRPPLSLISPVPCCPNPCSRPRPSSAPPPATAPAWASSMMPLPGLLSSHVPHLLPHDHRDHLESPYSLSLKKEQHDEESRSMSDISREDEQEKSKIESLANGPLLPEFNPYHIDPNGPSHYSNFVSYVPTPKPEWKRYKQYTKTDLMDAIEAVRSGMTALQASRKYKVPSRTLYDKIKKMGISTVPRRMPSKKPSPSSTDLETSTADTHAPPEHHDPPPRDARDARDPPLPDHDKRHHKSATSDDDDHSASGAPVVIDDEDESSSPTPGSTPALGSFSLVGRKMYENGAGESSAKPLDLTDTESLLPKRAEIEERA